MQIAAISRVRNESDIIEAAVRHNLATVDRLLILNHGSTDSTPEILRALRSEGLPIEILEDPNFHVTQTEHMSKLLKKAAAEYDAAWVVPLDADEFIITPPDMRFRDVLQNYDAADSVLEICWKTYVPDPSDNPHELNPVIRMRHRLSAEAHPWSKVVVSGELIRSQDISLSEGNHQVLSNQKVWPTILLEDAALAHFPVRSAGQYALKLITAHMRYRPQPVMQQGFHHIRPYERLRTNYKEFSESIYELARQYAVPLDQKFSPQTVSDPVRYLGENLQHTRPFNDTQFAITNALALLEELSGYTP